MAERVTELMLPGAHETDAVTGMNVGTRHYHVAVDVDPTIEPRGEQRHAGFGAHVVLRDLDEHADQVLLHELLHVITGHVVPADTFGPMNHRLISHLEVALWEAGYRRPPLVTVQPAEEGR